MEYSVLFRYLVIKSNDYIKGYDEKDYKKQDLLDMLSSAADDVILLAKLNKTNLINKY